MSGRNLEGEIEELKRQLEDANKKLAKYSVAEGQRVLDEAAAKKIADEDVLFRTLPNEVYPGMRYLKADDVSGINAIKYHPSYIRRLAQDGSENGIPAIKVDGEVFLTPTSIEAILKRQEGRTRKGNQSLRRGGRKPGDRNRNPL